MAIAFMGVDLAKNVFSFKMQKGPPCSRSGFGGKACSPNWLTFPLVGSA